MDKMTITEALAETQTIAKRIEKKQDFINRYLFRQSELRDPHQNDGGSAALIAQELQAIDDMQKRLIGIRSAIQKANQENKIAIDNSNLTIADWLTWRREVAPQQQEFLANLAHRLENVRQAAQRAGGTVVYQDSSSGKDFIVNINESKLAEMIEKLETVLGKLDGQLSLKNATIVVEF